MAEALYPLHGKRVWVAGHRGMVGAALVRRLEREGCSVLTTSRGETDLTKQTDVDRYVASAKPQAIFMAAAKVGGHATAFRGAQPADGVFPPLAAGALRLHRSLKQAFDPAGIFNRGRLVPDL